MATILHDFRIHSFVLMSNHCHGIITTPQANISAGMQRLLRVSSLRIGEGSNRINHIWGNRYHKTILGCDHYFKNAYKYNYFNPVEAGIVSRCEDYPYSTLRGLLGGEKLLFPVVEDTLLFPDTEATLAWLNMRPAKEHLDAVQASLRKPTFEHIKNRVTRRSFLRDDDVI